MNILELKTGDKYDSPHIKINDWENLHIQAIEVFTGDDEYHVTDNIKITVNNEGELPKLISHKQEISHKSSHRIRYEPCVRLYINDECGPIGNLYAVTITHHKGALIVDTEFISAPD